MTALYTSRSAEEMTSSKLSVVSIATRLVPEPGEVSDVILKPMLFGSVMFTNDSVSLPVPPFAAMLFNAYVKMVAPVH